MIHIQIILDFFKLHVVTTANKTEQEIRELAKKDVDYISTGGLQALVMVKSITESKGDTGSYTDQWTMLCLAFIVVLQGVPTHLFDITGDDTLWEVYYDVFRKKLDSQIMVMRE